MEGHPGSIHIPDNLDTSIPCVIGKTALVQEIRHRPTAMGGGHRLGAVGVVWGWGTSFGAVGIV